MSRHRSTVLDWIDAGRIAPGREASALRTAGVTPGPADWRGFLVALALWLGTLAFACAVIFFFAFNWDDLSRFAKFGLVEAAIVAGLGALWWTGLERPAGKALLVLLSLLVGALLALTGQVYQTGADSYELFGWWAALILLWVLVGRFSPLWLFWLGLLNMAIILYPGWDVAEPVVLWALFGLNALALVAWEAGHRFGTSWLADDWPPRLVAMASAVAATMLMIWAIVEREGMGGGQALAMLAYAGWIGGLYGWYRHVRSDLFMLAIGVLSLIVVFTVFMADHVIGDSAAGFLNVGLAVIGASAAAGLWRRAVAREQAA